MREAQRLAVCTVLWTLKQSRLGLTGSSTAERGAEGGPRRSIERYAWKPFCLWCCKRQGCCTSAARTVFWSLCLKREEFGFRNLRLNPSYKDRLDSWTLT